MSSTVSHDHCMFRTVPALLCLNGHGDFHPVTPMLVFAVTAAAKAVSGSGFPGMAEC